MKYKKAKLVNGRLAFYDEKEIDQSKLTADCWEIQFNGLKACETCDLKDTDECGGGETLKKLKNE